MRKKTDSQHPLVAIVGATATGKSAVAQRVADRTGATLLSVDSRKIYRGLDIGTAKPSPETICKYHYAMIDCAMPSERFSAGRFVEEARRIVTERHGKGQKVILVGGTGFYLDAFMHGLPELPTIEPETRQSVLDWASESGWPAIHAELSRVDPAFAGCVHPSDQTRLLRAMETYRQTGEPLSRLLAEKTRQKAAWPITVLHVNHERETLYRRIAERSLRMVEAGLFEEVRGLLDSGLTADAPGLRTVGYRESIRHLTGEISEKQAIEEIIRNTRRYAKRQLTWFRHRPYALTIDAQDIDIQQISGIVLADSGS